MCFCSFKDLKTKLEAEVVTQCIVIKKISGGIKGLAQCFYSLFVISLHFSHKS